MALHTPAFAQKTISQTVGVVDKTVITSREVEVAYLLEKYAFGKNENLSLPFSGKILISQTSAYLLENVIYEEAKSFISTALDSSELKAKLQTFLQKLKASSDIKYWNRLEIGETELKMILTKKMQAKDFIELKRRTAQPLVNRQDVKDYYDKKRSKFSREPFDQVALKIREEIIEEKIDENMRDWLQTLRSKYEVKNLLLE